MQLDEVSQGPGGWQVLNGLVSAQDQRRGHVQKGEGKGKERVWANTMYLARPLECGLWLCKVGANPQIKLWGGAPVQLVHRLSREPNGRTVCLREGES